MDEDDQALGKPATCKKEQSRTGKRKHNISNPEKVNVWNIYSIYNSSFTVILKLSLKLNILSVKNNFSSVFSMIFKIFL